MEEENIVVEIYDPTDDLDESVENPKAYEESLNEEYVAPEKEYNSVVVAIAGTVLIALFCGFVYLVCAALLG